PPLPHPGTAASPARYPPLPRSIPPTLCGTTFGPFPLKRIGMGTEQSTAMLVLLCATGTRATAIATRRRRRRGRAQRLGLPGARRAIRLRTAGGQTIYRSALPGIAQAGRPRRTNAARGSSPVGLHPEPVPPL